MTYISDGTLYSYNKSTHINIYEYIQPYHNHECSLEQINHFLTWPSGGSWNWHCPSIQTARCGIPLAVVLYMNQQYWDWLQRIEWPTLMSSLTAHHYLWSLHCDSIVSFLRLVIPLYERKSSLKNTTYSSVITFCDLGYLNATKARC